MNISFLGLGVMGKPMATHLAKSNNTLTVYNRSNEKSIALQRELASITVANSIKGACENAAIIISCLGNDASLRQTAYGENGLFTHAKANTIWLDHTTTSATVAKELASACHEKGLYFIDAPVSGGEAGAVNGTLTVMAGGEKDAFEKAALIMKHYAKKITYMGPSGNGQLTKMVNQICIAGIVQGLSEALAFSQKAKLDSKTVVDAIAGGAAQSWQMDNRAHTMLEDKFDFGFAVEHMRKDLMLCLEEANALNATLPVAALVNEFYKDVSAMGGGRWDTSSLIKRL